VVRREDLAAAGLGGVSRKRPVSRHGHCVADRGDAGGMAGVAIAVDHQPRIALFDEGRIVPAREQPSHFADPEVDCDVSAQLGLRQAEVGQAARHPVAGMIAGEQEQTLSETVLHPDRRWVARPEKDVLICRVVRPHFAPAGHFMPLVNLSHVTTYRYSQPASFGDHTLMVRPRESYDQYLVSADLQVEPEPTEVRWLHDVFGNAVAIATFGSRASELTIQSTARVQHRPSELEDVHIEEYARTYPFTYASEDMPDLLRSIERQHHDPQRKIDTWARRFVGLDGRTGTLGMLSDMTEAIKREFTYLPRYTKGTQTPIETLERQTGTCRDYAMLMIEAVRALGLAARFVSGYVYNPEGTRRRRLGGGNTHAWVRVYLPGSGWVEFDPTNAIIGTSGLIRVAIARDIYQAVPVSGTWTGFPGSYLGMKVRVDAHVEQSGGPAEPGGPSAISANIGVP
jgi:transglutaminase-like putative cysteine protease